jgi:PIN domain nuclease of toxin-antitoxin system
MLVEETGVQVQDVTLEVAAAAAEFPHGFSSDPIDRIIAATARVLDLALVTKDADLLESPLLRTIW